MKRQRAIRRVPMGHRIRARRRALGIRQADLAVRVGISPSYLNMIEHNRRTVAGGLLLRLARALDVDIAALSDGEEVRLLAQVAELGADPVLAQTRFDPEAAARLVAQAPDAARAMLALYRAYRQARATETALRDSLAEDPLLAEARHQIITLITSIRAFSEILADYEDLSDAERRRYLATVAEESRRLTDSTRELFAIASGAVARDQHPSAVLEVEDFVQDRRNYFADLETAADALRRDALDGAAGGIERLAAWLSRERGLSVQLAAPEALAGAAERLQPDACRLELSEALPVESRRFRLARQIVAHALAGTIDAVLASHRFASPRAEALARDVLVSYGAGALLLPYDGFLAAAEALRYDIDRLQMRFGASFEQVCHRLTTLRRPGSEAIPFHFLRRDAAGNLSKRFSASGLPLPHYGAACTRWALHAAFLSPGRIVVQAARMPDDRRYLFIARTTSGTFGHASPAAPKAVMLGCAWEYGVRTVYAAGAVEVPVGVTCSLCPREGCGERAAPWLEARRRAPAR